MQVIKVDIVSDIVCPWCVIGYRQLVEALLQTDIRATIEWHPFELNPTMDDEGENLGEHIIRKYGISDQESESNRKRLVALGHSLNFKFVFDGESRIYPPHRAHQLLAWASEIDQSGESEITDCNNLDDKSDSEYSLAHRLKLAMFESYFSEGKNINDPSTLAAIVEQLGYRDSDALTALDSQRFAQSVLAHEKVWTTQGIQGVPAMIFNQKYLVTGAQGIERYSQILEQLESV